MAELTLYIGNKNYSSWSLRAWLMLEQAGAAFDEVVLPLDEPGVRVPAILPHSPSGKVPALRHGELTIWESLAIGEYVAELFPEAKLWPEDRGARAVARAVSCEMATGFADVRANLPMNLRRKAPPRPLAEPVARQIARIQQIWRECRERYGAGGDFLFGRFTIADAMYAPIVTRFQTYSVEVDEVARGYMEAIEGLPAMQAWRAAALEEPQRIKAYEAIADGAS
jgi:glutathione S-transferase